MSASVLDRPQLFNFDLGTTPALTSDDWYTPREYIEMAREVMQGIDLDPASSTVAQTTVKASNYFTLDTNGLNQSWYGRVWLNPPYSMPGIRRFVDKLIDEYHADRIEQAIIIVNNATDTGWFHDLLTNARTVCFTKGRIQFRSPIHAGESPRQGQAFFYFGQNAAIFSERFRVKGKVIHLADLHQLNPAPTND